MATKINSISFQNFYNYYGNYEDNWYEFSEGLNLIVADNGAGKSKFFNGLLWILYNKVLVSETKDYRNVDLVKFSMISDKAKKEAEIDDDVRTGVKIEYSDSNNNYQIIKEIIAFKRKNENPTDENNWDIHISDPKVNIKGKLHHDFKPEFEKEQQTRIINNLLRAEFRDYALLQGEEVDKIVDLTNEESLTKAIDSLSNIKDIEELGELSSYLLKRSNKDLDQQRKLATKNENKLNELLDRRKNLERDLGRKNEEIERNAKALTQAENEKEEILNSLATAKKRQDVRNKLKEYEGEYKELEEAHASLYEEINNYFFDDRFAWLMLGVGEHIEEFSNKKEEYINQREDKRAEQKIKEDPEKYFKYLPSHVPDMTSLQRMLEKEVCFVCGQKAEEGSDAWNHIKNVKLRPKHEEEKKSFVKNNLSRFFDDLQSNTRGLQPKISSITESVRKIREQEQELIQRKEELNEKIEIQENELFGIGGDKKDSTDDVNAIQTYGNIEQRISDYQNKKDHYEHEIQKLKHILSSVKKEIEEISEHSIPDQYKNNYEVLNDLNQAIQNTKERILVRMIETLEKEANKHFENLTKYSGIKGSNLKFKRTPNKTVRMKVEDSNGNIVTGESEGFQRMKKIAVVMAIISSSKRGMLNYPFIADAPISAFGKAFTRGFFEQVPEIFHQSIILVKDLYDKKSEDKLTDYGTELFKNKIPSTFYINEIEEDKEPIERETKILKYL